MEDGSPFVAGDRVIIPGFGDFSPAEALDLGSSLIAQAKQALLVETLPPPWDQERVIRISPTAAADTQADSLLNFSDLVERKISQGLDWRAAWRLGRELLDSDYGATTDDDWTLVVGRSRRLQLSLEMISWAQIQASGDLYLIKELTRLLSSTTRKRLLAL